MPIVVRPLPAVAEPVEVVERKGLGHPDTICDAVAEEVGRALCRHYLDHFGAILHHNVDKALLRGGRAAPAFGGGEVLEPIELLLAGRATESVRGAIVPVADIAIDAARAWLGRTMHALDLQRHVATRCLVRPGSVDLVDLFGRRGGRGPWLANDTSIGVGYAPRTDVERAVLAADAELRALAASEATPYVGEDTKIMAVRRGDVVELTVACAIIGRFVADARDYADKRDAIRDRVSRAAGAASPALTFGVQVNAADDLAAGRVYLTVTGTSAESGDDGEVGRGNRVTGLITPYRPMTLEAAAGKNPTSHVGKIYGVAAQRIAGDLVETVPGVAEARCWMVSRIGQPVTAPQIVDVAVRVEDGVDLSALRTAIEERVRARLESLDELTAAFVRGEVTLF